MVSKKVLLVLSMTVLMITAGCSAAKPDVKQNVKAVEVKPVDAPLIITRSTDFIDIDNSTVKFLFKTELKSNVEVYIGETPDKLDIIEKSENYDNKGVKVSGLSSGKEYFYKIISKLGEKKAESKVSSFKKLSYEKMPNAVWPKDSIFYEIFVRSFYDANNDGQGDFKGITKKLDYIKDLGVNALWLMPMMDTPSYHGYDISDYYKVEPEYGTMEDFEEMVKTAHEKGIKVIIDLVINHTAMDNKWFVDAQKNGAYRDYYIFADKFDNTKEKGEWGQSTWYREKKNTFHAIFSMGMPDLNFRNQKVRAEMKNVAKFWIDKGVDGFRLDATKHIDEDSEVTHSWWKEFNAYVKSVNPNTYLVGEAWDNYNVSGKFFADMDSTFNFSMQTTINNMVSGMNSTVVKDVNEMAGLFEKINPDYIDATFIANHDMNRIGSTVGGDALKEKLAITILMTTPGTPFMYYGEELGMKGEKPDPYIREPMEWYAAAKGEGMPNMEKWADVVEYGKPNDGISVEEEQSNPESMLNYYKKLIQIRRDNPFLFKTLPKKVNGLSQRMNGYDVVGNDYTIRVVYNLNREEKIYELNMEGYQNSIELISGSVEKRFSLKPNEVIVLKLMK